MSFGHHNEHNKPSFHKQLKKEPESIIPRDILEVFDASDIPKVFDFLNEHYRLNRNFWKRRFREAFSKAPHSLSEMEVFYRYARANWEKSINALKGFDEFRPTMDTILREVVKSKIQEKKREAGHIQEKYGVNPRYKITNTKY